MNILVTGAAGFIGSVLCKEMEAIGHQVVGCDTFAFGNEKALLGFNGKILRKDFAELSGSELSDIDVVLHQASISDPSYSDSKTIMDINYSKAAKLIERCNANGTHIIYSSSSAVYGNSKVPNLEFHSEKPLNAYAESKFKLDLFAVEKTKQSHSQVLGLRYFNVYGPGELYKGKCSSIVFNFLSTMMIGKRPAIYGDGNQKRDFVYIRDIVDANLLAIRCGKSGVINVGSGSAVSFNELTRLIADELGVNIDPIYIPNPDPAGYQTHTLASLENSSKLIDYSPKWTIKRGIAQYHRYLEDVI